MLKSIQKIKGLGVYAGYTPPAGTAEFGVKNLIYGWNYSGKTTLSRLFALLEAKKPNPDLPDCSFSIDTDQGAVTEANYQTCSHTVRVFNSDFVTENLNFSGTSFKPILLLGSESEAAQKEIERCEALAKRSLAGSDAAKKSIDDAKKAMDKAKTEAASRIKSTMSLVSAFGATQLDKELQTVGLGLTDHELVAAALEADLKLARSSDQDQLPTVPKVALSPTFADLHVQAIALLAKTPSLASTIDHLVKNPLIESWVETGLPLHDDKTACEFCGGNLDAHRMAGIKAHFSKDLASHKQEVQDLLTKVESAKLSMAQRMEVEINTQFRSRFSTAQADAQKAVDAFNAEVSTLTDELRQKIQTPFAALVPKAIDAEKATAVTTAADALNEVIDDNNKLTNNFSTEKAAAISRLKLHYAQEFSKKTDLVSYEAAKRRSAKHQKKYYWCSEQLDIEIRRLKAIISQAQRGREEINKRIEALLGSESVQISVIKTGELERFQLVRRDGKPAKHLSEGEKTAIAFSFFLTKLRELKALDEAIVYIDDPISSLDSNHIFQVTAMIKETFFYQDGDGGPWKTRCKQAFFSTHNFEFFSLLRELSPSGKAARHYLV
ncbi:MAG: AAA family ATPase, partial [Alphaproteobacteria bacterium]|nr:AAA family ATPase [Alphaproteobacteria bacterium]